MEGKGGLGLKITRRGALRALAGLGGLATLGTNGQCYILPSSVLDATLRTLGSTSVTIKSLSLGQLVTRLNVSGVDHTGSLGFVVNGMFVGTDSASASVQQDDVVQWGYWSGSSFTGSFLTIAIQPIPA